MTALVGAFGEIIEDVIAITEVGLYYGGGHVDGDIRFFRGGCAPNVAAGCAQLGIPARVIGHRGADDVGDQLTRQLLKAGVEVVGPRRGVTATSLSIGIRKGDTALVFSAGDSRSMVPDDFVETHVQNLQIVHLNSHHIYSGQTRSAALKVIELCNSKGVALSLDVSAGNRLHGYGVERYLADLRLVRPKFLLANEMEAEVLGARHEIPEGVENLIIHRGRSTTIFLQPGAEPLEVDPLDVPEVIDTTGAGDAFAAGVLSGWVQSLSPADYLRMGHELAAETITHTGAEFAIEHQS